MDKQSLQKNTTENTEKVHHILVIEDSTEKKKVDLTLPNYSIGRHSSNDIVLSCQKTSRHHATLLRRTDLKNNQYSYWLLDGDLKGNKSRNGVLVNNKKCLIHELKNGDIIEFSIEATAKYQIVANVPEIVETDSSFAFRKQIASSSVKNNDRTIISQETPYYSSQDVITTAYSDREFHDFAELCSQPIIEIDLYGQIKFLNLAANLAFSDIHEQKLNHPLLKDLISQCNVNKGQIFTREIIIENKAYQQKSRYFPGSKLIRSFITDLTKRRELEKKLLKQQAIYQNVTKKISEGIIVVDLATKHIVEANHYSSIILGYTVEELLTMSIFDLCFNKEKLEDNFEKVETKKITLTGTYLLRHQNSLTIQVNLKIGVLNRENSDSIYLIINRYSEETEDNINYSKVRELTNKDVFYQQLSTAVANAKRYRKLSAVMLLDLNLLPEIEENLDNEHSDFLLSTIEKRLRGGLRAGDPVVLWQKNQFALLLSQIEAVEEAAKICHRVQQSLKQSFKVGTRLINTNINIGIAIYPQDGIELNVLLKNVDTALRRAKKNNESYQFFNSNTNSQVAKRLQIEQLLERATEREEFELYYQSRASIDNKEIRSLKASIAWEHLLEVEDAPTTSFIDIAEQTGAIVPLGEWAIKTACLQGKTWQDLGLLSASDIEVDLSPVQFQQSNLVSAIAQILTETEFAPALLKLNIAVATLMSDVEYSQQTIEQLRKLGIKISISNLASDFYSWKTLKKFFFDTLKIEQSLIRELNDEPQNLAIISALVELGKGLNLEIVVEGIETEKQVELLGSFQYEPMQGYWSSPSLSTAETTNLLRDRSSSEPE